MKAALFLVCIGFLFAEDEIPDWLNFDAQKNQPIGEEKIGNLNQIPSQGWDRKETQVLEEEAPLSSRSLLPSLEPWSGSPHLLKQEIRLEFKAKNYPKVLELIEILLAHETGHGEMLYKKAFTLRQVGKFQESLGVYNQVIEAKPRFRDAWYDRWSSGKVRKDGRRPQEL